MESLRRRCEADSAKPGGAYAHQHGLSERAAYRTQLLLSTDRISVVEGVARRAALHKEVSTQVRNPRSNQQARLLPVVRAVVWQSSETPSPCLKDSAPRPAEKLPPSVPVRRVRDSAIVARSRAA